MSEQDDLMQGVHQDNEHDEVKQEQPEEQQDTSEPEQESFLQYGDRVFKSKDEVLKKMEHADRYIEERKQKEQELQERLEQLEQELSKAKKLEDAMQELKEPTRKDTQEGGNTNQPSQSVDPEKLKQEVLESIRKEQEQATAKANREANLAKAHEAASTKYGAGYMGTLEQQAKDRGLDLSKQDIIDLAARKPATFSELFGLKGQSKPSPAPQGGYKVSSEQAPKQTKGKVSWKEQAQETAKRLGVEGYGPGFHSNQR